MSNIAVILENYFEDSEYSRPAEDFRKAGHTLVHIGIKKGDQVTGKNHESKVTIDKSIEEVNADDFDALFIPGGFSPDRLRVYPEVVNFVRKFDEEGKLILAICHAPQILITANVLKGRKITGWKSIVQDIKNSGAQYMDQEVVEDDNLISSRSPEDIPAFTKKSLQKLNALKMVKH
jgi:protease I